MLPSVHPVLGETVFPAKRGNLKTTGRFNLIYFTQGHLRLREDGELPRCTANRPEQAWDPGVLGAWLLTRVHSYGLLYVRPLSLPWDSHKSKADPQFLPGMMSGRSRGVPPMGPTSSSFSSQPWLWALRPWCWAPWASLGQESQPPP